MLRYIADYNGKLTGETENSDPVCGKDFCDTCGDCLACFWEDDCNGEEGQNHFWVRYLDRKATNDQDK